MEKSRTSANLKLMLDMGTGMFQAEVAADRWTGEIVSELSTSKSPAVEVEEDEDAIKHKKKDD